VENYFNYFTEIEEHFQRRRGGPLLVSTVDWGLIEIWKDSGIPLEAVLRGIDEAFDKYERRPSKAQKINGLAWCAQAVLAAAEDMKEAAVGSSGEKKRGETARGFEISEIVAFLRRNAKLLLAAKKLPEARGVSGRAVAEETSDTLREIASNLESQKALPRLEDLERLLTVLEEKVFAILLTGTPDEQIVQMRGEADHELAPYRRKMPAPQIEQLQRQYVHKRLMELYGLPRLSLFYMS
jgi:transcriptional regulator with XRE-family HTH domain